MVAAALMVAMIGLFPGGAGAQTAPTLGGAESFAVLGGSTVTNIGSSSVVGDLGVNPGTAVTGFATVDSGPGTVSGSIYTGTDPEAVDARAGVTAAYTSLNQPCSTVPDGDLTGQDLGGLTLVEGVYCFDVAAAMNGTLTLDGQGDPNAVFIIRTGSTLTTGSGSSVSLVNEANACNVFWQIGSSATLGTTTNFAGNILAAVDITLNNGAQITGRALAGTGAVTMDNNIVDASQCIALSESATATAAADATASADATSTAVADATAAAIADATSTAAAGATATAIAEATLTPLPPATATAVAEATATAIAAATLTPVPPATATAIAIATATAESTLTPITPATLTATAQATLTPATSTPTTTVTTVATGTATAQQTPTTAAPGAPSTGTGPSSHGSSPSLAIAVVGAALLLIGAGGFAVLATRPGGRVRGPSR